MYVRHLSLTDFRSYPSVELELSPGVTAFVGPNGQGKTNLVEALGYLATLGSHRVALDAPLVRAGAERAVLVTLARFLPPLVKQQPSRHPPSTSLTVTSYASSCVTRKLACGSSLKSTKDGSIASTRRPATQLPPHSAARSRRAVIAAM